MLPCCPGFDGALTKRPAQAMELEVARAAFVRVRDHRAVELVDRIAAGVRGGVARGLLLGDALAWQGRHGEAARCYVNEGRLDKVCVPSCMAGVHWS